jgi:hypothetical protein
VYCYRYLPFPPPSVHHNKNNTAHSRFSFFFFSFLIITNRPTTTTTTTTTKFPFPHLRIVAISIRFPRAEIIDFIPRLFITNSHLQHTLRILDLDTMAGGKGKSSGGKSSGGKTSVDGPKKQQSHSARAGLQVRTTTLRRAFHDDFRDSFGMSCRCFQRVTGRMRFMQTTLRLDSALDDCAGQLRRIERDRLPGSLPTTRDAPRCAFESDARNTFETTTTTAT